MPTSKGFGFCVYKDQNHANEAVAKLNGYPMADKTLTVRRSGDRGMAGQIAPAMGGPSLPRLPSFMTNGGGMGGGMPGMGMPGKSKSEHILAFASHYSYIHRTY